ncbi:MAG: S41 family peptidase [Bacteroidales bacterium]|nr:S41 family peptidase [Bacteroidales bacterium]
MKTSLNFVLVLTFALILSSCEKLLLEKETDDTPVENFTLLWQTANDKYSFFNYKGIEWEQIYEDYRPRVQDDMNDYELFTLLSEMLNELRDGHVNLSAPFDVSRYNFDYYSPENFNFRVLKDHYIGWDYRRTGPLVNTSFIRSGKEIGYIYYGSFSQYIENADIDFTIAALWHTEGIILDVRSNGGGDVGNISRLASRFADGKRLVYRSVIKDGPGENDFSDPEEVYFEPAGSRQYLKTVVLLTNRRCYSATSFFALSMKAFPHVVLLGDTTGGGLGAPAGFELPNGWGYRFSVTQTYSPEGYNWENGVPPDIAVWNTPEDEAAGIDAIMESGIQIILD